MRHIAIIIIFGTLLLQGCGDNRNKEVTTKTNYKVHTETLSSAPMNNPENSVAVVPAITPVRKQVRYRTIRRAKSETVMTNDMTNDEVSTRRSALYQAQEETPLRDKTYNELQISDDVNDYPFTPEAIRLDMENYK